MNCEVSHAKQNDEIYKSMETKKQERQIHTKMNISLLHDIWLHGKTIFFLRKKGYS